jgi:hypothetical protein
MPAIPTLTNKEITIDALRKKITSLRKKGIPPSPQVFRNSFNNVRNEIKILSQTKANYIRRPSVKRDYTNSFGWHIVNPFPYAPRSNSLFGVTISITTAMFPLLGDCFLITFSSQSKFLINCAKDCFMGLDFFPPFLAAWKSDFSVPSFSKQQQSQELCVVHAPPCLLQGRSVSRYELSGTVVSTRLLRTFFIAVRRFLVARSDGLFGSLLVTLLAVPGFLVARCVGLTGYFLATYTLGCLKRKKERTHVHRSPTFLVKVKLILPCVRAR